MKRSFEEIKEQKIKDIMARYYEFDFPELLVLLRTELGLTQKSLMKDTGIPDYTLHTWEKGKIIRPPQYRHLVNLGDYFGVSSRLLKAKAEEFCESKKQGTKRKCI